MQSMVDIPAGTIALRDDRLGTRWQVELSAFRLARFPVTDSGDLPLTGLSWYDAIALCNQLSAVVGLAPAYVIDGSEVRWDTDSPGYRLPTEAEWQYACTAGTPAYRYGPLEDIAWYADNSAGRAHAVGLKAPNAWGLHDMLGNIWEWCWDLYDPATYGSYRIFRGGGFADPERSIGSTVRRRSHPTFAIEDLGLRLAQSVEGVKAL
ncbi:sulfatase-modifying factor enzyme 1 [Kribbella steppae]|uniref:Sulfatase-modifying factor enzyme 1 n=1 Tax=Kribbella steppae TaxID=2512223 RepID=A0A4R2H0Q0_9ACTN|nr:SUMF1/EgtB/PvdO family nonheme iron enzyme [Kribbella steppae]TCO18052.1 sulfatase-modifying factor enzyme 1 [Kribbella steppae]